MNPAEYVCQAYESIFSLPVEQATSLGWSVPIPQFPTELITSLFRLTIDQLNKDPVLAEMTTPVYVVGDIHGNIFDLCRVLIYTQPPPKTKILFLGDYVDRGEFSIDVITLLFALYCKYPNHIVLLRGNHEFQNVNEIYGFMQEVADQYHHDDLYILANTVFNYLPMAAVVSGRIFAVHGGLSPDLKNLAEIQAFRKPIDQYFNTVLADLVWSDPSTEKSDYYRSSRGTGVTFGEVAVKNFFNITGLTQIVRGHQCVPLGVAKFANSRVYTVFSCSNYADARGNRCGILFIDDEFKFHSFSLPPLEIPSRAQTRFTTGASASGMTDSLALNLKLKDLQKHRLRGTSLQAGNEIEFSPGSMSRSTDNIKKKTLLGRRASPKTMGVCSDSLPPLHPH